MAGNPTHGRRAGGRLLLDEPTNLPDGTELVDEADRFLLRHADHPGAARVRQLRATLAGSPALQR